MSPTATKGTRATLEQQRAELDKRHAAVQRAFGEAATAAKDLREQEALAELDGDADKVGSLREQRRAAEEFLSAARDDNETILVAKAKLAKRVADAEQRGRVAEAEEAASALTRARKGLDTAARSFRRELHGADAARQEFERHRELVAECEAQARDSADAAGVQAPPDDFDEPDFRAGIDVDAFRGLLEKGPRMPVASAETTAERLAREIRNERRRQRLREEVEREQRIDWAVSQVRHHWDSDSPRNQQSSVDKWLGPLSPDERQEAEAELAQKLRESWVRRLWG